MLKSSSCLILDGGLATELEARGLDLTDELWSARCLADAPDEIVAVHLDYLRAGADCIITASYQATLEGFQRRGLSRAESELLLRRSVELALTARAEFLRGSSRSPLVAASIGPYGAALADGSEYTGRYGLDEDELLAFHAPRLRLLADAGADLLACETIPSAPEARALARLLRDSPLPAWIGFSCHAGKLHDGTPLPKIAEEVLEIAGDRVLAVGVNCLPPEQVLRHLEELAAVTDLPLVAYPNSGESWDARAKAWRSGTTVGDAEAFADLARRWHAAGARLIGGCCRTGPATIRALRAALGDPISDAPISDDKS